MKILSLWYIKDSLLYLGFLFQLTMKLKKKCFLKFSQLVSIELLLLFASVIYGRQIHILVFKFYYLLICAMVLIANCIIVPDSTDSRNNKTRVTFSDPDVIELDSLETDVSVYRDIDRPVNVEKDVTSFSLIVAKIIEVAVEIMKLIVGLL